MDEAKDVLRRLQRQYPSHANEIKELMKRTFQFDSPQPKPQLQKKEDQPRRIGFDIPQQEKKKPADEDFFGPPKRPAARPPKRNPAPPKPATPKPKSNPPSKTGIDFFDMDTSPKTNNSNKNNKFF